MLNDEDLKWLAHNAIELNRLLQHVAKQYDQVRLRFGKDLPLESLSAQIEPVLIIALGALVLLLALGVFLPMWDLGSAAMGKKG